MECITGACATESRGVLPTISLEALDRQIRPMYEWPCGAPSINNDAVVWRPCQRVSVSPSGDTATGCPPSDGMVHTRPRQVKAMRRPSCEKRGVLRSAYRMLPDSRLP